MAIYYKLTEVIGFMGQFIKKNGIFQDKNNIKAVEVIEIPKHKSELLDILGYNDIKFYYRPRYRLNKNTFLIT